MARRQEPGESAKAAKKPAKGSKPFKGKPAPDRQVSQKANIMVVDDSETTRKALDHLFSHKNEVFLAQDHTVAIEVMGGINFDLIISDLRMPSGTEGLDLLEWVKKHRPHTKFILMSADITEEDRRRARKMGVDAIIDKNDGTAGFLQPVGELLGLEAI